MEGGGGNQAEQAGDAATGTVETPPCAAFMCAP